MKIKIDNLSYKNNILLKDVQLDVEYGDFVCVIGVNGSGKSTLFKAFLGNVDYKGIIEIPSNDIGIVSDYSGIPEDVYVKDIYNFILKHTNDKTKTNVLIEKLCLQKIMGNKISKLSSGEKRKVELLSVLCSNKKIIIYDEVTTNLDKPSKEFILEFIKNYHNENKDKIGFYSSHDLEEIYAMDSKKWLIDPIEKSMVEISDDIKKTEIAEFLCGIRK